MRLPSLVQARWWSHEATQSGTSKVVVSCGQCTTNTACTLGMQVLPSLAQARWWSHEATQSGTSKVVVS
ncbi:hypothetical protein DPMN_025089 [Dreissena polymorpha]|uniref:Uncharacterized protein n=1 Tax=Dreissena polymorpha TaxID=45954 RepID=A0A9D4RBC8_DREPO|nr:hypothetical protein DPMN_025089 [Dreissena polymorpha]